MRLLQPKYILQLLFWLMYGLFMIQEMSGHAKVKGWSFCILPLAIYFLLMAYLIYFNTMVLIPRLLNRNKYALYFMALFGHMLIYALLRNTNQWYWDNLVWTEEPMAFSDYYYWNFIWALWFTIIGSMIYYVSNWSEQNQQVRNIQINQLQTELKYLRAQINPHFLFNGLNTIYGSIDRSNQQARDILVQFSDLLRYNLYEADVDYVELEKEGVYLQNYVALQKARSNTNLQVDLSIRIEDKTLKIAPLLFIAFLENAFKFSSRDDNRVNSIRISLQQSGNRVQFECENSYEENGQAPGGIGLTNARRRLELLYKDRYTLNIRRDTHHYFVQLILMT